MVDTALECLNVTSSYRRMLRQKVCALARNVTALLLVLALTAACLYTQSTYAALNVSVDRNPVSIDESFKLILESDEDIDGEPDFNNKLDADFEVMSQSNSTSIQIINGNTSRKIQWVVTLIPKRLGSLTIPAFNLGGFTSKPLTVKVVAARQLQSAQQSADLFLEVQALPDQGYVQQQILYTVHLYHSVNLANGSRLSEPEFPAGDAIVKRLGDDREYQTTIKGVRYVVIERKYLIFPQKSGQFTIPPLIFDGQIVDQQRGGNFMFSPFNQGTHHKRIRSDEVTLDIQAMPSGVIGTTWLPASNLQLVEQWSDTPPKFTVGEPVTRTIAIIADGLTSAQLPELNLTLPASVKAYPDQPVLKDNEDNNGITGIRQQKIALIPTEPGPLVLPEVQLTWWNTASRKMEKAVLPEQRIKVAGVAQKTGVAQAPFTVQVPSTAQPEQFQPIHQQNENNFNSSEAKNNDDIILNTANAGWWPWLSLGLAVAWLSTLILWWRKFPRRKAEAENATTMRSSKRQSQLENQLRQACESNDPVATKTALLSWAGGVWTQNHPTSLTALAGVCAVELRAAILELDQALYAANIDDWQGHGLWQQFERNKPSTPQYQTKATQYGLNPLHHLGA